MSLPYSVDELRIKSRTIFYEHNAKYPSNPK